MEILIQAFAKINRVRKQQQDFFIALIVGLLGTVGRKTFRNLARYTGLDEHTFSRQMAKELDTVGLNAAMIGASKQEGDALIAAQDPTFVPKSGKYTPGLDYFWSGTSGAVEKGLEADTIGVVRINDQRKEGYGLSVKQTPADPTPYAERKKRKKKNKQDVTRIDSYLAHLKSVVSNLLTLGIQYIAVDNGLAKDKYVNGVVAAGLHVISKGRRDMRLQRAYTGPQKKLGRKRKMDTSKVRAEDFQQSAVTAFNDEDEHRIELRECVAYSLSLKRQVKVVMVRKHISPTCFGEVYLFSTDTNLSSMLIHRYYVARFQIEFVFRDAKNYTGFIDCQSRNEQRLRYHFNASITALNVAKLQDHKLQVETGIVKPFSLASWVRKYIVDSVANRFIEMFDLDRNAVKSNPRYQELLAFGSIMQ